MIVEMQLRFSSNVMGFAMLTLGEIFPNRRVISPEDSSASRRDVRGDVLPFEGDAHNLFSSKTTRRLHRGARHQGSQGGLWSTTNATEVDES